MASKKMNGTGKLVIGIFSIVITLAAVVYGAGKAMQKVEMQTKTDATQDNRIRTVEIKVAECQTVVAVQEAILLRIERNTDQTAKDLSELKEHGGLFGQ